MPQKRTVLFASLTAIVVLSTIVISNKAFHPTEESPALTTQRPNKAAQSNFSPKAENSASENHSSNTADSTDSEKPASNKEALVSFSDEASYQKFLSTLASKGLTLISSSDRLLAVRIGFSKFSQLDGIEGADISPNFPVSIPDRPNVSAQDGAIGFRDSALRSIGITGDNSSWGEGVTVAVIDSGVNDHIALKDGVSRILLSELAEGTEQLSHGTAVASIISGDHPSTPGVAPASDILSVRVTDGSGRSDTYTLAEGILAAVDGGAQVINISMGSPNGSAILESAIRYAQDQGIVIVASSGNEGLDSISYPSAYSGVISVGAIEANGEHLDFSNQGDNLTLTAPGFQVHAAWGENQLTGFSGTSASAPFFSGAIAAILSHYPSYTPQQASNHLLQHLNEGGLPGSDPQYGGGTLDVGRALENGTPGIYDIAVTGQILQTNDNGTDTVTVVIQNQGTETLVNSPVSVNTPSGTTQITINSLPPGSVHTSTIPVSSTEQGFSVTTSAKTSSSNDSDLRNNSLQTNFNKAKE